MTGYDAKSIGRRVAAYRRIAGMTAEQLADAVGNGMTRTAVAKLENGHRVEVSTELLVQLAWALQVPPLVLLLPVEDPQAYISVGDTKDSMEGLGYWIEGLALPDVPESRASRVGNAVHSEYRRLTAGMVDYLNDIVQLVEAQDGKGGSRLDQLTRDRLSASIGDQTMRLRASREVLAMLREQLGLSDG
ncbi:helix-turn-helix transcriptional regulator [Microbacterium hominis]|uniref:helix-turn-helix transcriptional regulator n=1 Tax=Microbacterium hominis TaxID=162426 RepID=UPI001964F1C3|nr:helix-turn-helix transcriptional regulator [Microbacterium hominis]QRY39432.1 helix-turn-helix transcriptional regulator [Microbacterium hominis]